MFWVKMHIDQPKIRLDTWSGLVKRSDVAHIYLKNEVLRQRDLSHILRLSADNIRVVRYYSSLYLFIFIKILYIMVIQSNEFELSETNNYNKMKISENFCVFYPYGIKF